MTSLDAVCPCAARFPRGDRRALTAGLFCVGAIVLLLAANALLGWAGTFGTRVLPDWGPSAVDVLVALIVALRVMRSGDASRAWALFAAGLALYGLGSILWSAWLEHLTQAPIPSPSDVLWLSMYPLSYLGILGLSRAEGGGRVPLRVWLDAIIASAGVAALGATLVLGPVLTAARASGSAGGFELAYPIADVLLIALVIGTIALRGWQVPRMWRLLGGGFAVLAVADCLYAVDVARGGTTPTRLISLGYVAGTALLGLAAWQPTPDPLRPTVTVRNTLAIPGLFTLAAVGLLQYDHLHRLDPIAFGLADLTLAAALARCALAIRDIQGLAEARRQAATDHLTSLPNRRSLMRQSREAIVRARAAGGGIAVMMMDIDNFKEINDTLGHNAGDLLLSQIGPRLRSRLRGRDVIGRLGGDEFVIVLEGCADHAAALAIADSILAGLRRPFSVAGLSLQISASIGVAMYPEDGADEQELLSRADVAMYQAKRARGGVEFYVHDRDTHSTERLSLGAELAVALERGELEVHFQPKGRVDTREIVGVEALVRWRRRDGRLVAPGQFLQAAERVGLSGAITTIVLEATLTQLAAWRAQGIVIHAAVNTTVADLLDLTFPERVGAALERAGLSPGVLVLEITESAVLVEPERIGVVLDALHRLGVALSLDDFGTGFSSLSHLVNLPVCELKLDRSFVREVGTVPAQTAVVEAMVGLGHRLGLAIVAEGVEQELPWPLLARMGCDYVQGNSLGRPAVAEQLTPRLLAEARRTAPARLAVG